MARAVRGKAPRPRPRPPRGLAASSWRLLVGGAAGGGLGIAAAAYVGVDYLRYLSPAWHGRLMPALWAALALAAAARAPFYRHWSAELRAALPFLGSIAFMLGAFLCEAVSVRFVSAVMGLQWHRSVRFPGAMELTDCSVPWILGGFKLFNSYLLHFFNLDLGGRFKLFDCGRILWCDIEEVCW